jgi:glycosyltransferase involved in cell wall biosynthesis
VVGRARSGDGAGARPGRGRPALGTAWYDGALTTSAAPADAAGTAGPLAAIVSYRLGGSDGVSVEATKWQKALHALGFGIRRVAGSFGDEEPARSGDVVVPGLAIDRVPGIDPWGPADPGVVAALVDGLGDADLVVVENLCSLPLNLAASRAAAAAVEVVGPPGGSARVVLHHHDLPWQRPHLRHVDDVPPRPPGAVHVTINGLSCRQLAERGIAATTIRNHFDLDGPPGDRARGRIALGLDDDDVLVFHPTRAIPRKDVPAAVTFTERLGEVTGRPARYWLSGPAEDGYGPTLDRVLSAATVPVHRGLGDLAIADAYAACDVVAFPSTWEGFGNPVVESVLAGRPLVAAGYPALDELGDLGLRWLPIDDPEPAAAFLARPDLDLLAANRAVVAAHLDLAELPRRLAEVFEAAGWSSTRGMP